MAAENSPLVGSDVDDNQVFGKETEQGSLAEERKICDESRLAGLSRSRKSSNVTSATPATYSLEVHRLDADRLFVSTLHDLDQRTTAADEYTVLMSSALLRKLLLDQDRLIDQVNRVHRLKPYFRISGVSPFEQMLHKQEPDFWVIEDGLDPDSPLAYAPFDATLSNS